MRPSESFVGQPVRSLQTMLRVLSERFPDLPTIIPDGIYGPQTMTAVTAFQRKAGIPVTGVADQATWEAVAAQYRPALTHQAKAEPIQVILNPGQVIRAGEYSRWLFLAQAMLLMLAADYGEIPTVVANGTLDPATAASLERFQNLSGLPPTGELDKVTWKHLSLQSTLNSNRTSHRSSDTETIRRGM